MLIEGWLVLVLMWIVGCVDVKLTVDDDTDARHQEDAEYP